MKLEMRTVQKIAAAAMTLAVMFGCASPLKPLAASAAQNTVSVSADIDEENSYISAQDQMYQKDFLKLINKARAKAGLNSVELGDAAHNAAAAERAEELATTYSYVRPNGQRDFTVFAENGIGDVSVGENYLAGVSTPDSAMDQWMNLDFARERILNVDATTVSVGHYEGGAYGNYWVLIFSYPENSHTDDFRQEVLDLVNVERAKYGLTPLVMGDANLTAAAQKRAEEIATVNSHTRPDGSKCFTVLKEYGVTCTFFVVGNWADQYPEQAKAIVDSGNELMNHSNAHDHYNSLTADQIIADVNTCNDKIEALTGVRPTLIRCPFGEYDDHVISTIRSIGMEPIQWDVEALAAVGRRKSMKK